ncbi:MAG: prepilin-type N-terminal cleavage/methylation domain-containing protein [Bryobacterales bacterium]|jgi:type IV pilus assembly protein PilA|nr:prepilin-type N-terminal cleavage/methylation domain-containing protein [Bryobacterales bacterium]
MIAPKFRVNRQITRRGFTLMELMIVVAIILIILLIAVPKYNNAIMQANEVAAIRMVGSIHTTQAQYQSQFGKYAVTLQELGPPPSGNPGPAAADLLPGDLAKGKKSGYNFQMQGTPGGYTLSVTPENYNSSGRRSFYSDQSMVIRENWGPEPATAASKEVGN